MKVHDNMRLRLTIEGMVAFTTLQSFLEVNEFTKTEVKKIRQFLKEGRPYYGGGGAMCFWKVEGWDD